MWQPVASAPFNRDLELAVFEKGEACTLVFPCRRTRDGWIDAVTMERIDLQPTHWREWAKKS